MGALHPYAYAFNNPVNLTDPSGRFVPLLVPLILGGAIGGGFAAVAYMQAHPCADFWSDRDFQRAVGVGILGGIAGAGVGMVAGFAVGFAFGVSGGSFLGAVASGIITGGASGAATQMTANALTGRPLHEGVLEAAVSGAVAGGAFAGAGYGAGRAVRGISNRVSFSNNPGNAKPVPVQRELPEGVKWVDIDTLEPIHDIDQSRMNRAADFIKAEGYDPTRPIAVRQGPSGRNIVVQGHHRVAATKSLGYNRIPARIKPDLDDWAENLADRWKVVLEGRGVTDKWSPF